MAKKDNFEAVCVFKVGDSLCRSFSLTIEGDRVIASRELTRAEDVPAIAIGHAQRTLWNQFRVNRMDKRQDGEKKSV